MLKKIEIYLAIVSVAAFTLNLFLIPGSSILLTLSLSALSVMYLYFSFALLNNVSLVAVFKQKALNKISIFKTLGAILVGGALSVALIGVLFKLMQWPNANFLFFATLPFILISGGVYFVLFKKNKEPYYKNILIRLWIVGSVVFLLFILPKDLLLDFKYRNNPDYLEAFKDWREDNSDSVKIEKYEEELRKLNQ